MELSAVWAITAGVIRKAAVNRSVRHLVAVGLLSGSLLVPGLASAEICYQPLKTSPSPARGKDSHLASGGGSTDIAPQHWCPPTEPDPEPWVPPRAAVYLSHSVPTNMVVGQYYTVSVTMQNSGTATWTLSDGYKLGSQNPADNWTWGVNRVGVVGSVPEGSTTTFTFSVRAPTTAGTYNFQWRMVDDGEAWFGDLTPNVGVNVVASTVTGYVDGLSAGDISGWACSTKINSSIDVHLYLGGPYGTGTGIGSYRADLASEAAVASACQASGTAYRFRIPVTSEMVLNHGGKTIYVYGISPVGASNNLLGNSGAFRVPTNAAPSVALTSPTANQVHQQGATVTLSANASDADGNLTRVQFLVNGAVVAEDTAAPFTATWTGNPGTYTATARAYDTYGANTTSAGVSFRINSRPWVTLTSPANGATATAPATLQLTADAGDAEGISSVQFIVNGAVVATDTAAPYAYTWAGVGAGTHAVYARVSDTLGAVASSATATVTVNPQALAAGAVSRVYVYDQHQRLCKVIEPETGTTVMDYDAAGNLAWSAAGLNLTNPSDASCVPDRATAYASGRRVDRTYDARNRITFLAFPDSRGNQSWQYWPDGLVKSTIVDNDGPATGTVVQEFTYNKRRLLTGESLSQPGWYTWGIGYGYNPNGHLVSQSYPDGFIANYGVNALGQTTSVTSNWGTHASGVSYHPNGAMKQFTYGNGIVHTMVQNARQLPARSTDSGGALDHEYSYDGNGNVGVIADRARGDHFSRWMEYDKADRLTAAGSCSFGGDCWHRFTYDVLDNMRSWTLAGVKDQHYYYDPSRNQLNNVNASTGATIVGLEYDVQGNLATRNSQAYVFDYGNRLRQVVGKESYRYDGAGRRALASASVGGNILSHYTQAGQLLFQQDERRHLNIPHIYLNGSLLATLEWSWDTNSGVVKYQHTDALGSPVAVSNAAGQVIERTDYEPYGAAIGKAVQGVGYTGHVMDAATGLTYMQQRYYDPGIGRFLSVDPVSADMVTGWNFNRYTYAANNPYKFTDPDGREIRFAPGAPASFYRNAAAAIRYLNAAHAANGIGTIHASDNVVTVRMAKDRTDAAQTNYNAETNVLTWADQGAIEVVDASTGESGVMSPALGFGHEIEHAMNDFYGNLAADQNTPDSQYDTQEERNVIEEYEGPAAERLGEPQRADHSGKPVKVDCSVPSCK